jgi:hypothetical protein
MGRPRKRRPVEAARIQALLDGAPIRLDELCEWIRRSNPTRLSLTKTERGDRYAVKARLQSELIHRFAPELHVLRTGRPGVVGLVRRDRRGDGGHALISDLTEEARAWVGSHLSRRERDV